MSRMPVDEEPKCDYVHCVAGTGLAGMGTCFLRGEWDNPECPNFEAEDEFTAKRWIERYKQLSAWAKEAAKDYVIKEEWPDCGKPYYVCLGCGQEAKKPGLISHTDCLYIRAKALGLLED